MQIRAGILWVFILLLVVIGCGRSPESRRDRHLAKGKELLQRKDFTRAMLEFRNASQAMPNDAEPYYQYGVAAASGRDLRTAALSFRKAVDLNPKHAGAQLKLAELMASTNDPELLKDAQTRLQGLLQGNEPTVEMLNALAFTNLKLGHTGDSVQYLEEVLARSPGELTASLLLARTKMK
jgi:cytochrome c-type biogenesis protein CcmH/NrfG